MALWAKWLLQVGPIGSFIVNRLCSIMRWPIIEVRYNCGHANSLYIRGELASLNWAQGVQMTQIGQDRWLWIAPAPDRGHFKVLVNDKIYEEGPNHLLKGLRASVRPIFDMPVDTDRA